MHVYIYRYNIKPDYNESSNNLSIATTDSLIESIWIRDGD